MSNIIVKIAIAENSVIIRNGISATLKRLPDLRIQPVEIHSIESLKECIRMDNISIVIVNPAFGGYFDVAKFKVETSGTSKMIALVSSFVDKSTLNKYDETLSVYDDQKTIYEKINSLLSQPKKRSQEDDEMLSAREKEIIVYVVKGMTNKEIADNLFISIHTVITHRRNIAKKLQIHSTAGLTIYAIVNNLIEISEIKKEII
ncbi:response regulator transcription factor [Bacteroides sedimenti]|uniref:Helix-turn-helix transcriptional regulator n=1 Tax=Bacteroides sedimenti TaxID=2136147 RepID=A0ABM8IFR6_9BACE